MNHTDAPNSLGHKNSSTGIIPVTQIESDLGRWVPTCTHPSLRLVLKARLARVPFRSLAQDQEASREASREASKPVSEWGLADYENKTLFQKQFMTTIK